MKFWKQLKSLAGERGQVLVVFAILLPLLIGGPGLSIDIGSAMLNRTQAQKAKPSIDRTRVRINCWFQ